MKNNAPSEFSFFMDGNLKKMIENGLLFFLLILCINGFGQGVFGGKIAVLQGSTSTTTWFNTGSQACDGAGTGNLSASNTSAYTAYLGDKFYLGGNTLTYGFPSSGDGSFLQWRYYVVGGVAPGWSSALTLPYSSTGVCSSGSNKKYEYVPNTGANSIQCTVAGSYRLDTNLVGYQNGNNYTIFISGNYIPFTVNALGNPTSCAASISGTTASLSWTKFTGGSTTYNVMIVRYPKDATPTTPINGTSYSINSSIGAGTVVYATGAGTTTTNSVTASTNYDYYFYSENWSYYSSGQKVTAIAPTPTITLGTNPSVCRGATSANLPYSATTNSPNQYSIVYDSTALGVGFSNITNATLSSSPIVLTVPGAAAAGTYNGTVTVKNTTSGLVSGSYPFSVTITSLPTAGITNNTGVTKVTCSVPSINVTATGGTSYSWSNGASIVGTSNNLSITSAGTYTVTVTNSNSCTSTANIVISQDTTTTSSSQSVTACDNYKWALNGTTYTTSGTYNYIGVNAAGCTDSKTLVLTINNSTSSSQSITACDSYFWSANSTTYTESGTYVYTSTNASGCNDTKTLVLTINHSTSSSQTISACDSFTWTVNETTYTTSGTYSYTSTNASGCSDTKTLVLTIYVSTPSSQTISACDSYFWSVNGNSYTTSGTYVFEGTNAAGCSQNQTLYLTINSSTSSSQSVTACDSYTWPENGQMYTTSGTYTYVGTNASGCTNTKTLVLTINNSTSSSQTISACENYTWPVNGTSYNTSGTYTFISSNASGCTDTKTLNLIITPNTNSITNISVCDSYTWSANGTSYIESGTYTYVSGCDTKTLVLTITPSTTNTTTQTVCDSYTWSINGQTYTTSGTRTISTDCHTEVLNLTINKSTTSNQTVSACDTYTWPVNGNSYTTSGTYTYVSTNVSGCTDTKTLILTINNSSSSSQTVSACGSYTWSANGTTYTTSGTYTKVGTNASGCTDTKTLVLTISPINKSIATSTWTNGQDDSVTGLGAWGLSTIGTTAGFFTGSSDVNNGGSTSWAMYASGGTNVASAVRPVSFGVGNTLSFSMDNGYVDSGKVIGFGLQNTSGQNLMEVLFIGGQTFYTLNDSILGFATSIGYTSGGMDIYISYTALNTYSITIKTKAGATATYSARTFSTQSGGQKPAQIRFFNAGAGAGSNYDLFFNSLAINNPIITTQPSTASQNICIGSIPTDLTVAASGSGLTYQWYSNSTNSYSGASIISGANSNNFSPQNTTTGTLYYYCSVTDPCGTTFSNLSGGIKVSAPLNVGVLSGTQEICVSGLTTFSTNGTTGGTWNSANTSIASVNSLGVITGAGEGSTLITYSLNGIGGCPSASVSREITIDILPTAGITNNTGLTKVTCSVPEINVTATGGGSYSWSNGSIVVGTSESLAISSAGTYTVTVSNLNGCSATANIIITQDTATTSSSESVTACDSYKWSINDTTYSSSGTYTYSGTNAAGCTDTKTLVLTINNSSTTEETQVACDTYTWNGTTYTTSGDKTFTSTNASGCTNVATLHLTINNSSTTEETQVACDTYTWNGTTYSTSGDKTFTSTNASGCTNVATLHLTINNSSTTEETQVACDAYTWSVNGATYTASGNQIYTYTNSYGCPNTSTLVLTINTSSVYYADGDGDGFGNPLISIISCTQPTGYVTNNNDCNDADTTKWQSGSFYLDTDGDGYTADSAGTLCYGTTTPIGYSTTSLGADCNDAVYSTTNTCSSVVNLKLILQGYYDADVQAMRPVMLNQGEGSSDTDVDTITVELHDEFGAMAASATGVLQTDGTITLNFTPVTGDYYLVVSHRNTLTTSSASLVSFTSGVATNYDFSTAASQVYGDNQIEVAPGVFAMYTGDLNQDGYIDAVDYPLFDSDNLSGASGNYATDMNGDGYVDAVDYPIFDFNNLNGVTSYLPY